MSQQHDNVGPKVKVRITSTVTGFMYRSIPADAMYDRGVISLDRSRLAYNKSLKMFLLRHYDYNRWCYISKPELYEFKLSEHKPRWLKSHAIV